MMPPGLKQCAQPKPPVRVVEDWLKPSKGLSLFQALESGPWHNLKLRYGNIARRKNIVFYEGDPQAASAYTTKATDKEPPISYGDGPSQLREVRSRLQEEYGLSFSLCYINYYADEGVGIGWHNDAEEVGSQVPVRMLCLGGTRTFSIWKVRRNGDGKLQTPFAEWEVETKSGDLVEMPQGFHEEDSYRHAVLPQKQFSAARISLTFRNPDLSATGPWGAAKEAARLHPIPDTKPHVYCCKAGHEYPKDAVYVGCKSVRGQVREGSIFGNAVNPLKVRNKKCNPWAAGGDPQMKPTEKEAAFKAYALNKMEDPDFQSCVDKLRGQNLLCWCEQEGKNPADFCHARVWLELANLNKELL